MFSRGKLNGGQKIRGESNDTRGTRKSKLMFLRTNEGMIRSGRADSLSKVLFDFAALLPLDDLQRSSKLGKVWDRAHGGIAAHQIEFRGW